jgi:hypothetical protein
MLLPGVRILPLPKALFDWLRKFRLAMGNISDVSRMSVRSRYSSGPKNPGLSAKVNCSLR